MAAASSGVAARSGTDFDEPIPDDSRLRVQIIPVGPSSGPSTYNKVTSSWPAVLKVESENTVRTVPDRWQGRWHANKSDVLAFELLQRHGFFVPGRTLSNAEVSEGESLNLLTSADTLGFLSEIFT